MRFPGVAAWMSGDPVGDDGLRTLLAGAVPYALPMRRRFRGVEVREGVLLRGPSGWGEFAPFEGYDASVCARWLGSAVEAAYGTWPAARWAEVPVNAIVPAVDPDDAALLTREAVQRDGCTTVKVKVAEPGGSLAVDDARVGAVRAALDDLLGPGVGRIRVDANAAWDVATAVTALRRLGLHGLEYAEQPCRTLEELAEVRLAVEVPLAADESVRLADDPGGVRVRGAVDVVVVKVPPLGGVAAALDVATRVGLPVVVSGALDSAVGLSAGLALAAALPDLPYACGLGTGALLAADVVAEPRRPHGGRLGVARVDPDLDALLAARSRMSDARARWWRHRLADAWAAGARDAVGHLVGAPVDPST